MKQGRAESGTLLGLNASLGSSTGLRPNIGLVSNTQVWLSTRLRSNTGLGRGPGRSRGPRRSRGPGQGRGSVSTGSSGCSPTAGQVSTPVSLYNRSIKLIHYFYPRCRSATMESLIERIESAELRLIFLEKTLQLSTSSKKTSDSPSIKDPSTETGESRVINHLRACKVFSYRFVRVPSDYYDQSLDWRANILSCMTRQLCKSIVFENTACDHKSIDDFTNSRFYLIVVQYEARFDSDLLRNLIHSLRPKANQLPKKRFNFRMASTEDNAEFTGYLHNAVSPFGTSKRLPVVVCKRCIEISPPYLYLGGGEVDLKLGVATTDFLNALNPIVGLVSHLRADVGED